MRIYFAADHAGFELKNTLLEFVQALGHETEDRGAYAYDPTDDYPEIIARAARALSADTQAGIASRAILIGASGQGEAMAANRFRGVRCALYYGAPQSEQTDLSGKQLDMISSTREHNDANALALGARFLEVKEAQAAVSAWLAAPFSGEERHARRIRALDELS